MRKGTASVAAVLAVALIGPGHALAETSAQVRQLATRAVAGDEAALVRLRGVDEVDGRPVAVGAALAGASGSDLTQRLRVLAASNTSPSNATSSSASADAADILSGRRFQDDKGMRPFRGVLSWLGGILHTVVGRPFSWLADQVPGGDLALEAVLAACFLGAVAYAATLLSNRTGGVLVERSWTQGDGRESGRDPAVLERQADEAERRGDLELALRLRFRAGLMRLEKAGSIPRGQRTSRELRRALKLVEFDRVSRRFDEIVYGRRAPSQGDVEAARSDWRVILDRAGAA